MYPIAISFQVVLQKPVVPFFLLRASDVAHYALSMPLLQARIVIFILEGKIERKTTTIF